MHDSPPSATLAAHRSRAPTRSWSTRTTCTATTRPTATSPRVRPAPQAAAPPTLLLWALSPRAKAQPCSCPGARGSASGNEEAHTPRLVSQLELFSSTRRHTRYWRDSSSDVCSSDLTKRSFPDQFDLATPAIKQVPAQWYEDTFDAFTPSASLSYRWSEAAMTYVSYAEGFKGGG